MQIKCKLHNLYSNISNNKNLKALILFTAIILTILLIGLGIFLWLIKSEVKHKNVLIIFIIIVIGGAFGGYVDLYRGDKQFTGALIKEKIITGIACGCLVPLFLNTISSTLITETKTKVQNYYVLLGIVMIASIFSNDFLNMMKNKIIERDEKIKELEKKVEQLRDDRQNEEKDLNINPSSSTQELPENDLMTSLINPK